MRFEPLVDTSVKYLRTYAHHQVMLCGRMTRNKDVVLHQCRRLLS